MGTSGVSAGTGGVNRPHSNRKARLMTKLTRFSISGVTMVALSAILACTAPTASPEVSDAPVASTEQAFSVGCTTATLSGKNGAVLTIPANSNGIAYSPDDQYNACSPKQFVVEITNATNTYANHYYVDWGQPLPGNATDCANSRLFVETYGWNGSAWVNAGADYIGYQWNGSSCIRGAHGTGYPVINSDINLLDSNASQNFNGFSKVRLSVQAFTWLPAAPGGTSNRPDYKTVAAGMVHIIP
jgi:hypothetical protein